MGRWVCRGSYACVMRIENMCSLPPKVGGIEAGVKISRSVGHLHLRVDVETIPLDDVQLKSLSDHLVNSVRTHGLLDDVSIHHLYFQTRL